MACKAYGSWTPRRSPSCRQGILRLLYVSKQIKVASLMKTLLLTAILSIDALAEKIADDIMKGA